MVSGIIGDCCYSETQLKVWGEEIFLIFDSFSYSFFSPSCRSFVGEPNVIRFGSLGGIRMTEKYARFQNNF